MTLPTVKAIRNRLAEIENAITDEPYTSDVDLGDIPCVPISQPEEPKFSDIISPNNLAEEPGDDEPSIIFEIPPDFDERAVREMLGQVEGSEFERLIEVRGTDALAWYFPFHWRTAQHGIYISSKGAFWLAERYFRGKYSENPGENLSKKLRFAAHALLRHELFHFAAECMVANWELTTGAACYVRAKEKLRSPPEYRYIDDEEALANAYMIRGFRWVSSATLGARATPSLQRFCAAQPHGYNRGNHYVPTSRYERGCRELAFAYHDTMDLSWFAKRESFDSFSLYPNAARIDATRCPILMVDEEHMFARHGIVSKYFT
jgi:hypothetical protein